MKKHKTKIALLVALLVALLPTLALAGAAYTEHYGEVGQLTTKAAPTFTSAFSDLDGTDSTTWGATALAGRTLRTDGDPLLEITTRHSAPGATACIEVGRRARDGSFHGVADIQTSTALAGNEVVHDGTGYYGRPLYFAANGWHTLEVRVTDASGSSTVSLKPVMQGVTARAAQ